MAKGFRDLASAVARNSIRGASGPTSPAARRSALAHRIFARLTGLSMEEHRLDLEKARIEHRLGLLNARLGQIARERQDLMARVENDESVAEPPPANGMSLEY